MVMLSIIFYLCLPLLRFPSSFLVFVKYSNSLLVLALQIKVTCLFLIAFVMDNDVLALLMLASLAILSDKYMLYIQKPHLSCNTIFLDISTDCPSCIDIHQYRFYLFSDDCPKNWMGDVCFARISYMKGFFCLVIRLFFSVTHMSFDVINTPRLDEDVRPSTAPVQCGMAFFFFILP